MGSEVGFNEESKGSQNHSYLRLSSSFPLDKLVGYLWFGWRAQKSHSCLSLEAKLKWEGGPVCKGILWLQERQRALKGTAWFSMTCLQVPWQGLAIGNMGNSVPLSELLGFPLQNNH